MIGGVIFLVGLIGVVAYTGFLMWESGRGTRIFALERKELDRTVSKIYRVLVFGEIPRTVRTNVFSYLRSLVHEGVHLLAALVRAIEQPLARTSSRLQSSRESENVEAQAPSPFLKSIVDSKKKDGKSTENSV